MKLTFKRNTGLKTPEWLLLLSYDVRVWFDNKEDEDYTIEDLHRFIISHIDSLGRQHYIRSAVTSYITEDRKGIVIMRGNAVVQTYFLQS